MSVRLFILCFIFSTAAAAQSSFDSPQFIHFDQKTYQLTDSSTESNRKMYEYMVEGENLDNWQTMITISFFVGAQLDAKKLKASQEKTIGQDDTLARQFVINKDNLYTMVGYKPIDPSGSSMLETSYEANVGKAFFKGSCQGVVVFEFAQRIPINTVDVDQVMKADLNRIYKKLAALPWQPGCHS